jgi:hypothetical protein
MMQALTKYAKLSVIGKLMIGGNKMLELKAYGTIPTADMKDLATAIFVLVDDLYQDVTPAGIKNRQNGKNAILSDSEIIAISIMGEIMSNDSEKAWHAYVGRNFRDLFPRMCDRTRFNRTRRCLMKVIELIRLNLNLYYDYYEDDLRIIDSFPVKACEFGRARFHKSFKGFGATYGVCPSKKLTYYGYKTHALCTANGFISDIIFTSASTDDREAVFELVETYNGHMTMIGDKGYISAPLASDLDSEKGIGLIYMKKKNAKQQPPADIRRAIFKTRRRIETSFSQLADQFKAETARAKTLWGLQARLQTKILAYNLCFILNQMLGRSYFDIPKIKGLVF